MAGPRSLSRSTKVAAPAGASGKHSKGKGKHQKKYSKKPSVLPTWDHDNSSGDDESGDAESTMAPAPAAGKKRPRVEGGDKGGDRAPAEALAEQQDDVEGEESSGGGWKRRRAGVDASGEGGSSGGEEGEGSDGGEGSAGGEEDRGASKASAVTGGMGDVMARILGQKLDARVQAPVLAKRKTKAMKEMENASVKRAETRGKSAVRRANRTQQFVIPDHTTTDYERQLKKIATRGVVALFNAISKRQNQSDGANASGNAIGGAAKAAAVKGASRHAFLDMLKTGVKPTGGPASAAGAAGSGGAAESERKGSGSAEGEAGENGGRSWSVLKEDYMMGASTMKNWDQDSADSEAEAVGGPNDMSEDDDSD